MIVLGIDIGTTATKTVALNEHGSIIGRGYREYNLDSRSGGIVEQDPDDWIQAVISSVDDAVRLIPDRSDIRALSLSTQGATMTAVDGDFRSLCPAITWMDNRAVREADYLREHIGDERIYKKCGWGVGASYDISKIIWLQRNRPEVYSQSHSFVSTIEYINHFLTGRNTADPTNAAIRGMYNINTMEWDDEILRAAGVDISLLPEVMPTGAFIGTLTGNAASLLRLDRDVRVYNGAHDQYCAALGCGALDSGDMLLSTGTTWVVLGITDKPVYTESRISPGKHPRGNLYGAMASLTTAGSALKWFKELTGAVSYADIDTHAARCRDTAADLFFMPYIAGSGFPERMPGIGGCMAGARLHHTKYDIALALMEGVAFETKNALLEFGRAGINIGSLRMVGGAAKSVLWSSIVGSVTGCKITRMTESEGCALGAAMIAAVGICMFDSYKSAADRSVGGDEIKTGSEADRVFYNDKFTRYNELAGAIKGVLKKW
ncbi:MAG: FGGY family carbohydrate kinase [Eubacteriales bacterium]|nr:FGGY family carbohydrate kinase [Eubacteriales bacterium]